MESTPECFTPIDTVSVTATEENHFAAADYAALDRHGHDTYDIRHNFQLDLHTYISIMGIKVTMLMLQAIIQNATLLHTCLLLLNCVEFL